MGSIYCTPRIWWDFLGFDDNGYSPFKITYDHGVDTEESADGHPYHYALILSCQETPLTMRLVVAVQTTQRRVSNVPSLGSSPLKDVLDSSTQFVIKVALA